MSWASFRRNKVEVRKPFVFGSNAWIEPTGAAVMFEDFLADHVAEDSVYQVNQSGTPTTAAAVGTAAGPQSGHLGWIAGSADNADVTDEIALGAKPWSLVSASTMTVAEVGFVIPSALTARQYFIGLTDDETEGSGSEGPLTIDGTTNVAAVAANAAGFIFSSLATDADGYYTGYVNATTPVADGTNSGLTGVVDDYTRLRVEVDSAGNAYFFGGIVGTGNNRGSQLDHLVTSASAVATTAILIPMFAASPTTTTAVEWEVDYMLGAAGSV